MTLNVRKATAGDEGLVLNFINALAVYEKLADEVTATEAHITKALFGASPKAFAIIAELNGEPVGFALYFFNFSTFLGKHGLYLEDLFVHEHARGHGAGKALLQKLAQIARENDCGRMEWCVLDWNTPAIEFYKSLGANVMDEWSTFRLTGDALASLASEG